MREHLTEIAFRKSVVVATELIDPFWPVSELKYDIDFFVITDVVF